MRHCVVLGSSGAAGWSSSLVYCHCHTLLPFECADESCLCLVLHVGVPTFEFCELVFHLVEASSERLHFCSCLSSDLASCLVVFSPCFFSPIFFCSFFLYIFSIHCAITGSMLATFMPSPNLPSQGCRSRYHNRPFFIICMFLKIKPVVMAVGKLTMNHLRNFFLLWIFSSHLDVSPGG